MTPSRYGVVGACPIPRAGVACAASCLMMILALLLAAFVAGESWWTSWARGRIAEVYVRGVVTLNPGAMALVAP